ncbi:MAG: lamin tail domain-containing protein, partial [Chlorobiales bacterium]|nr:lamin tail domain-containing protein [Chlorobiales bacterium]
MVPSTELSFALSPWGGRLFLTAFAPDGLSQRVLDAVAYAGLRNGQSYGRYPAGADHWETFTTPTMLAPNQDPFIHDIVINEIMYNHPTRDERYDYIELRNHGSRSVSLKGWAFTDGIDFHFRSDQDLASGDYLVVAKDPNFLATIYPHLLPGLNLTGPYQGDLANGGERIRLSYPHPDRASVWLSADEVRYYDGGVWPTQADGDGASLELCDPKVLNHSANAWGPSNESQKNTWQPFGFTVDANDPNYTHDAITLVDMMLLHRGEVLLDDLEVTISGVPGRSRVNNNVLTNGGFEAGSAPWRILGNHIQSFVTDQDAHSGKRCLHLIATGHGDPGANRINQSIPNVTGGTITFKGWARWLSGNAYLLMRTTRERAPVQPPRPSHAFKLMQPPAGGTP